jgi:hypothetical protein
MRAIMNSRTSLYRLDQRDALSATRMCRRGGVERVAARAFEVPRAAWRGLRILKDRSVLRD